MLIFPGSAVIQFVKSRGIEIRFSSEDSFRSDLVDLLSIYSAVDKVGVNRVSTFLSQYHSLATRTGAYSTRTVDDFRLRERLCKFPDKLMLTRPRKRLG